MALGLVLNRSRQVPAEDSPAFGAIAERFRRAGDLERAVALCQEGLQKYPSHVSARVTLGWSLLDIGRYEEARAELEQALKRAPDNLAAIRGLAELHDRSEHDEVAAMQRSGEKWMAEAAASAVAVAPDDVKHLAPIVIAGTGSFAAPDPLAAPVADAEAGLDLDESLEALDALRAIKAFNAFSSSGQAATETVEAPASDFARPSARVEQIRPVALVAPIVPAPQVSDAAPDPLAAGPWQPVEIETTAARVLQAAPVTPLVIAPVALTSNADVVMSETPDLTVEHLEPFGSPVPADVAELGGLDDFDAPLPAPVAAFAPAAFAAVEPPASAPVARPLVLTPMVSMPVAQPALIDDEFDPAMPALPVEPVVDHEWSEMASDAFVLPAAVEAARATADEGPGPWPPIIADDPVDPPAVAAMEAAPGRVAPVRRPNVHALNRFLRRVETRRATVVAQYLAG